MKKIFLLLILSLTTVSELIPQRSWQTFSDLSIKELSSRFSDPPAEYGMILWWGWDGPMSDTVIKRDLDWIAPEGDWKIFVAGHRFRSSQTRSVNNPTRGKDTTAQ